MLSTLPKKAKSEEQNDIFLEGFGTKHVKVPTLKRLIWYQKISKELRHDASMYRDLFSHPYLFLSPSRGVQLIGGMTVAQPNEATTRCLIFIHVYNTISNKYVISNKYIKYIIIMYYIKEVLYMISLKNINIDALYQCDIRYYDVYTYIVIYIHCTNTDCMYSYGSLQGCFDGGATT